MKPIATVLYEDTMLPSAGGNYPLHDLVMRLVEDDINGETWRLHKAVDKNPRRGIGNLLNDIAATKLVAGAGDLFVLLDRDVLPKQLGLPHSATDLQIVGALKQRSDAPAKLHVFLLQPNLEGLLRAIQACDKTLLPGRIQAALKKKLNDRDVVFSEVRKASQLALRRCIRTAQPGLDGLVRSLAALVTVKLTR